MTEAEAKEKIQKRGKAQEDGELFCPRCGRPTMKYKLVTNALRRHADIYICDECGTDEAIRDFTRNVLPYGYWVAAEDEDFMSRAVEALRRDSDAVSDSGGCSTV